MSSRRAALRRLLSAREDVAAGGGEPNEVAAAVQGINGTRGESALLEEIGYTSNATVALGVSRAILDGDWAALDSLLAPDFTYHGDLGTPYSRDEYIGFMQAMKGAMSDMKMDFTHTVAQGELVSVRFVTTARQTGKFMGAPATKKNVEIRGIFMRRVVDGKVLRSGKPPICCG